MHERIRRLCDARARSTAVMSGAPEGVAAEGSGS